MRRRTTIKCNRYITYVKKLYPYIDDMFFMDDEDMFEIYTERILFYSEEKRMVDNCDRLLLYFGLNQVLFRVVSHAMINRYIRRDFDGKLSCL